ncbi:orotate phosphoribosyltransferase [Pyruvatibacter mobilis]|uniref:orotate phosphoribosyltransferase n=1 Tax=Pyruvatibacter mobilis TaxID=1712261 RepID=UPI003D1153F6
MTDSALSLDQVLDEFRAAGALLEGHFILSSGRHSDTYLEKNKVFMDPARTAKLAAALAGKVRAQLGDGIDVVVAPAVGAIIPGYEMARQLGLKSMFTEREDGKFVFRRNFVLDPGARVLMVEDIVTTGLSSRECLAAIREAGGNPVAAACFVDRSGGKADLGVPMIPLAQLDVPSYAPDELPDALAAIPAIKPGSRNLKA